MTSNNAINAAPVERAALARIKLMWAALAARADKESWPAARFLAALAEHEVADRDRRRIERHLASARLPAGKTFDTFDFKPCPWSARRRSWRSPPATAGSIRCQYLALQAARRGQEPSCGCLALVQNGRRVLFMRTTDLVQKLQVARRELGLEAAITKLDKYQLLILDDIACVSRDQCSVRADRRPL
jgi:DNA replication protein DnaC